MVALNEKSDSRLSTRTLANGVTAGFGYDAANNITTLAYVNSTGTTLASFGNTYDAANMRTSITDLAGNITTLTYDGAYQVASQTGDGSATLGWANMTVSQWADLTVDQWATLPVDGSEILQTNQYDNSGNALVMVTAAGTATNSYDPANRLTSSISPLGNTTLTYDGRNRRTGIQTPDGGITTYTWTDDDQLAAIALPNSGGTVSNVYDGDGLRFSRTDADGTNSYLWNNQILEAQLGAGNTVSAWYTQGMGEYGDIISTRDASAGASSLQLYDASGNVNQTTNANAGITATLSYDTFGSVTDNSGPANPTVAWQGKQGYQFEQSLGLQYVRQRWYDPNTRQFISQDPLGFAGRDANLFRYAGNNPINRNDPGGTALEYIGNNLYWKVHPAETAWSIAHELTDHGAWYRKIFQRPSGGFSHLYSGELLSVNSANTGLIANHSWIAEPGQPRGPTIFVRGLRSGTGYGGGGRAGCLKNALEQYGKNVARTLSAYAEQLSRFGISDRELALAHLRQALQNFGISGLVGAVTGSALGAAAEAVQGTFAAAKVASLYRLGTASTDFTEGAISEAQFAAVRVTQFRNLMVFERAGLVTSTGKALATVTTGLVTAALTGELDVKGAVTEGLISTLPDPESEVFDAANYLTTAILDVARASPWDQGVGAGRSFGFLARGLNADLAALRQAEAECNGHYGYPFHQRPAEPRHTPFSNERSY